MKKSKVLLGSALLAVSLCGCASKTESKPIETVKETVESVETTEEIVEETESVEETVETESETTEEITEETSEAEETVEETEETTEENVGVADGKDTATLNLYKNLVTKENNFAFSPLSLNGCFGIIYDTAGGSTKEEIDSVLGFNSRNADFYKQYKDSLSFNGEYGVKMSNTAYINESLKDLLNTEYLNGDIKVEAFDEGITDRINNKVSEDTNGLIKELFEDDSITYDTASVLVNALYFKQKWNFEKTNISTWNGSDRELEAFKGELNGGFCKEVNDNIDVLMLPYDTDDADESYSLYIVCDNVDSKENNVDKFIESLSQEEFNDLFDYRTFGMSENYTNVEFYVPEFKMESKMNLTENLKEMGLKTAMSDQADFSKFGPLMIDEVMQAVYVDVNSEGTEAAAATGITMKVMSLAPEDKIIKTVVADSDFVFAIKDNINDVVMFMGRVTNPEK